MAHDAAEDVGRAPMPGRQAGTEQAQVPGQQASTGRLTMPSTRLSLDPGRC